MPPKRETDRAGQSAAAAERTEAPARPPSASAARVKVHWPLLEAVKRAGRSRARADERLIEACREARPHHSLREIADAAGVGHDTVDRWTKPS